MGLNKGLLIVLEGIDGSGKSTQAELLLEDLRRRGLDALSFREPSAGRWGREIKRKARRSDSLTPEQELELFLKDRKENVRGNLEPALKRKKVIVLDRYYYSTIAYQGAKGIDRQRILELHKPFAIEPDLVFILDVDARKGLGRIENRPDKDRLFEREEYLVKVGKIFKRLKGKNLIHIDASAPPDQIARKIAARVSRCIKKYTT
jgi:dTMP kinase